MIQLGQVTRVYKSETEGAQLCNIKAGLSDREYKDVAIITPKGMHYLPNIDDVISFIEISNNVILALGVVDSKDYNIQEGETLIHYDQNNYIYLKKDKTIKIKSEVKVEIEAPLVNII